MQVHYSDWAVQRRMRHGDDRAAPQPHTGRQAIENEADGARDSVRADVEEEHPLAEVSRPYSLGPKWEDDELAGHVWIHGRRDCGHIAVQKGGIASVDCGDRMGSGRNGCCQRRLARGVQQGSAEAGARGWVGGESRAPDFLIGLGSGARYPKGCILENVTN